MSLGLWRLSAVDLARGTRERDYWVVEVMESVLGRIESLNPPLNAISFDCSKDAMAVIETQADRSADQLWTRL